MCHPPIVLISTSYSPRRLMMDIKMWSESDHNLNIRWRERNEELDVSQHCYSWWVDKVVWCDWIYMCMENKSGPPNDPWGTHCTCMYWDLCVIRCRKLKRSSIFFCNTYSPLGVFPYHIWTKVNPPYQWYQHLYVQRFWVRRDQW